MILSSIYRGAHLPPCSFTIGARSNENLTSHKFSEVGPTYISINALTDCELAVVAFHPRNFDRGELVRAESGEAGSRALLPLLPISQSAVEVVQTVETASLRDLADRILASTLPLSTSSPSN